MEKVSCPACKKEHIEVLDNCDNCDFPFNGTEKERAVHIGRFINKKGVLIDSDTTIKKIQKLFFGIAGFNIILLVIHLLLGPLYTVNSFLDFIFFIVFLICGIFIHKRPLLFTIAPLVFMIGINALYYLIDPQLVLRGILYKIVVIGSLLYCIYIVLKAQDFKRKYDVG
ncbi:hypothetical protein [uncultured Dokdonia sp.]|uniref:hypothetical protein n=1 Tax=uncultured Dokdonia sp. TaxID=575653 RepID=UPI00261653B9|nr:hypothetical protein [uncultured Dokdonia sp.]